MNNCPKCESEVLVETPALGNVPLDVCPGCSGIWFDTGELETLLGQSQGGNSSADFSLIDPKGEGLVCPRCKNKMTRGGLLNPLLLVDKCQSWYLAGFARVGACAKTSWPFGRAL